MKIFFTIFFIVNNIRVEARSEMPILMDNFVITSILTQVHSL